MVVWFPSRYDEKMKKRYWNLLKTVLGITILLVLLYKVKITEVCRIVADFDFSYIHFIVVALIFVFLLDTLNIKILISKISSVSFLKLFKYFLLSWSVGLFVPGQIGQLSIIYLLKKEGISIGKGSAVILINKLIIFLTLSVLALFGFAIFFSIRLALYILGVIILIILALVFFILYDKGRFLIKRFILRKHSVKFAGFSKTLKFYFKNCKKRIILAFFLTMVKWGISAIVMFFLFQSVGHFVDYLKVFFITPMGVLVSFIPISLNGLGIRESTAIFLYSYIGINPTAVAGTYIINLIINYLIAVTSIGLFLDIFGKKTGR